MPAVVGVILGTDPVKFVGRYLAKGDLRQAIRKQYRSAFGSPDNLAEFLLSQHWYAIDANTDVSKPPVMAGQEREGNEPVGMGERIHLIGRDDEIESFSEEDDLWFATALYLLNVPGAKLATYEKQGSEWVLADTMDLNRVLPLRTKRP